MEEGDILAKFKELQTEGSNPPFAAIQVVLSFLKQTKATTMMELQIALAKVIEVLKTEENNPISVSSSCDLFNHFVTRPSFDGIPFEQCKSIIIERGSQYLKFIENSFRKIASLTERFVRENSKILIHGSMAPVEALLLSLSVRQRFSAYVTCGPSSCSTGQEMYRALDDQHTNTTLIPESAVAHFMDSIDIVLVGCEGVVENGGIINTIGTYQIAILAQKFKKPLYVVAESFKFVRIFPLNQRDLPESCRKQQKGFLDGFEGVVDAPMLDYTPPNYISLLITDLGVLTPAGVSEELIKLYL